jgi:hypothetical protein
LFFHSYECQWIQTKNPFDEILSLSFDLGPLKVNNMSDIESVLQRIIKRIHIIKHIWWKKNLKDKNLLTTLKKHSYLKIYGIVKLEKFKELSKIDPKF